MTNHARSRRTLLSMRRALTVLTAAALTGFTPGAVAAKTSDNSRCLEHGIISSCHQPAPKKTKPVKKKPTKPAAKKPKHLKKPTAKTPPRLQTPDPLTTPITLPSSLAPLVPVTPPVTPPVPVPAPVTPLVTTPTPTVPVSQPPTSDASGPIGDPGNWVSIFDDEFTGNSLNTRLWSTGWYGSGITGPINSSVEDECYDPAQVTAGGGELDLNLIAKTETCPTGSGPVTEAYAGSLISTMNKFVFTYGFLEARVWLPGNGQIADWPGIWADGAVWPQDGELDVLEGLGGQACYHFHYGTGPSDNNGPGGCVSTDYTRGWHTFGADWEPGVVTWYYDGVAVGTLTTGVTASPMYIILELTESSIYGGPLQTPATVKISDVRVWQHAS